MLLGNFSYFGKLIAEERYIHTRLYLNSYFLMLKRELLDLSIKFNYVSLSLSLIQFPPYIFRQRVLKRNRKILKTVKELFNPTEIILWTGNREGRYECTIFAKHL